MTPLSTVITPWPRPHRGKGPRTKAQARKLRGRQAQHELEERLAARKPPPGGNEGNRNGS